MHNVDPGRIYGMMMAYQQTEALQAAVELDLFTSIGEGVNTAAALAAKTGAAERGIRILLDFFGAHGMLGKQGDVYSLTEETGAFLNKHSPAYMGGLMGFVAAKGLREQFGALTEAVKKGGVAVDPEGSTAHYYAGWVDFARSMEAMMFPASQMIAGLVAGEEKPLRVLDVAASHGLFGFAIAKKNPQAHITALDWGNVLEVTQANAARHGLSERFAMIPGDAFTVDLAGPYDVILLTNLLHHFNEEAIVGLLKRMKAALAPGGQVVTLEFIPNEDRISPPPCATFSLVMLASTPEGDAYTQSEYRRMFGAAGYESVEFLPVAPTPQTLVVSR